MGPLKPKEILSATIEKGVEKANSRASQLFILGILAGFFLALAGAGANVGSYYFLSNSMFNGIGRLISGMIFPTGLMIITLSGGELFTGNNLMITSLFAKRITLLAMLRNWIIVYCGNLMGSVLVAWMFANSGLLGISDGLLETVVTNVAVGKVSLPLGQAVIRAILCNVLVCLAVWMATGADTVVGKILSIFFPVSLFVAMGLEHSVANMFSIPLGIFADGGATSELTWGTFFLNNLIPVTLGNIIGGGFIVGGTYYFAYKDKH